MELQALNGALEEDIYSEYSRDGPVGQGQADVDGGEGQVLNGDGRKIRFGTVLIYPLVTNIPEKDEQVTVYKKLKVTQESKALKGILNQTKLTICKEPPLDYELTPEELHSIRERTFLNKYLKNRKKQDLLKAACERIKRRKWQ